MSAVFYGLFTKKNIENISNGVALRKSDLEDYSGENLFDNKIPWYRYMNTISFYEWAVRISDNPIQYDCIHQEQIYFIEIPFINDIHLLNENLAKLAYPFNFSYFNYTQDKFQNSVDSTINKSTRNLIYNFNMQTHIKDTISAFKNDQVNHFILLSCAPTSRTVKDDCGYYLFPALFSGLYRKNLELWHYFDTFNGEFPDDQILSKPNTKAVIIPGSVSHVYDMENHTGNTITRIQDFVNNKKYSHVKFLGICFGHQIFSEANGGKVGKRKDNCVKTEQIAIDAELLKFNFMNFVEVKNKNEIIGKSIELHNDDAIAIPKFMKRFGSSPTCSNEILLSDDERFLTMQSHPEYTPEFYFFRVYNSLVAKGEFNDDNNDNACSPNRYKEAWIKENMDNFDREDILFREICHSFLKN